MKKLTRLLSALLITGSGVATLTSCSFKGTKIGVLLPAKVPALEVCEAGFIKGLEESGLKQDKDFKIYEKNADGKANDLNAFAKEFASSMDLMFGLGTDPAKYLKSAVSASGQIKPVLFSAVTDPVGAELVESLENGKGFVTGTTDAQPVADQIKLIKEILPEADSIGIMYTNGEQNSEVQAAEAKKAAEEEGLTVKTVTCDTTNVSTIAEELVSTTGIDAIYIPTDNNIASKMAVIKEHANPKGVLVVAGEENMLASGGHVTLSVNYEKLGIACGKMAAQVIKGEKQVGQIPVTGQSKDECTYFYSSANLAGSGIYIPDSFKERAKDITK